jgi:hypothetical protein
MMVFSARETRFFRRGSNLTKSQYMFMRWSHETELKSHENQVGKCQPKKVSVVERQSTYAHSHYPWRERQNAQGEFYTYIRRVSDCRSRWKKRFLFSASMRRPRRASRILAESRPIFGSEVGYSAKPWAVKSRAISSR